VQAMETHYAVNIACSRNISQMTSMDALAVGPAAHYLARTIWFRAQFHDNSVVV
jgi:hypothetical protein